MKFSFVGIAVSYLRPYLAKIYEGIDGCGKRWDIMREKKLDLIYYGI